ncbi:hypothetical protein [Flexibacterium corallicola]|uniref:hypothetical protein n=1 Tax=Flexibacterium corallicola TaxID=3037259 RepID=UPI00286FA9E7|nr:hypothetical protein [Pseudovibrio sp. M1P-2-3]
MENQVLFSDPGIGETMHTLWGVENGEIEAITKIPDTYFIEASQNDRLIAVSRIPTCRKEGSYYGYGYAPLVILQDREHLSDKFLITILEKLE